MEKQYKLLYSVNDRPSWGNWILFGCQVKIGSIFKKKIYIYLKIPANDASPLWNSCGSVFSFIYNMPWGWYYRYAVFLYSIFRRFLIRGLEWNWSPGHSSHRVLQQLYRPHLDYGIFFMVQEKSIRFSDYPFSTVPLSHSSLHWSHSPICLRISVMLMWIPSFPRRNISANC